MTSATQAGIPVPTEITQKVLTAAQHIGKGNTNVPGFDIPNVEELLYGQTVTGIVREIMRSDISSGLISTKHLNLMLLLQCSEK